jgi:hypothetical protein
MTRTEVVLKTLVYLLFNHLMWQLALGVSLNTVPMNMLDSVIIFVVYIVFFGCPASLDCHSVFENFLVWHHLKF